MKKQIPDKPTIILQAGLDDLRFTEGKPEQKPTYIDNALQVNTGNIASSEEDLRNVSKESRLILESPQYQKLISALRNATTKSRVVNFVTGEENKHFVELVVKAAFPPSSGKVFMPKGDFAAYDGEEGTLDPQKYDAEREKLCSSIEGDPQPYTAKDYLSLERDAAIQKDKASETVIVHLLNKIYSDFRKSFIHQQALQVGQGDDNAYATAQAMLTKANPPLLIDPNPANGIFKTFQEYYSWWKTNVGNMDEYKYVKENEGDPELVKPYHRDAATSCVLSALAPMSSGVSAGKPKASSPFAGKEPKDISKDTLRTPLVSAEQWSETVNGLVAYQNDVKRGLIPLSPAEAREQIANIATHIGKAREQLGHFLGEVDKVWAAGKSHDVSQFRPHRGSGFYSQQASMTQGKRATAEKAIKEMGGFVGLLQLFYAGRLPPKIITSAQVAFPQAGEKEKADLNKVIDDMTDQRKLAQEKGLLTTGADAMYTEKITKVKQQIVAVSNQYNPALNRKGFEQFCWKMMLVDFFEKKYVQENWVAKMKGYLAEIKGDPSCSAIADQVQKFLEAVGSYDSVISMLPAKFIAFYSNLKQKEQPAKNTAFQQASTQMSGVKLSGVSFNAPASEKDSTISDDIKLQDLRNMKTMQLTALKSVATPSVCILYNIDHDNSPFVREKQNDVSSTGLEKGTESAKEEKGPRRYFTETSALKNMIEGTSGIGKCLFVVSTNKIVFPGLGSKSVEAITMDDYFTNGDTTRKLLDLALEHYRKHIVEMGEGFKDVVENIGVSDKRRMVNTAMGHSYDKTRKIIDQTFFSYLQSVLKARTEGDKNSTFVIDGGQLAKICRQTSNQYSGQDLGDSLQIKAWNPMTAKTYFPEVAKLMEPVNPTPTVASEWQQLKSAMLNLENTQKAIEEMERRRYAIQRKLFKLEQQGMKEDPSYEYWQNELLRLAPKIERKQAEYEIQRYEKIGNHSTVYILYGVASSGKSAFAQALAALLGVDYGTLNLDRARGSLVGQTENATEAVFQRILQMSDIVLLCDEFDVMIKSRSHGGANTNSADDAQVKIVLQHLNDDRTEYHRRNVWLVLTTNYAEQIREQIQGRSTVLECIPVQSSKTWKQCLNSLAIRTENEQKGPAYDEIEGGDRKTQDDYFNAMKHKWDALMLEDSQHGNQIAKAFEEAYRKAWNQHQPPAERATPFPQRSMGQWLRFYLLFCGLWEKTGVQRKMWEEARTALASIAPVYNLWHAVRDQQADNLDIMASQNTYSLNDEMSLDGETVAKLYAAAKQAGQIVENKAYAVTVNDVNGKKVREGKIVDANPNEHKFMISGNIINHLKTVFNYVADYPAFCERNEYGVLIPASTPPARKGFPFGLQTAIECAKKSECFVEINQQHPDQSVVVTRYGPRILNEETRAQSMKEDKSKYGVVSEEDADVFGTDGAEEQAPSSGVDQPTLPLEGPQPADYITEMDLSGEANPLETPTEEPQVPEPSSQKTPSKKGKMPKETSSYYFDALVKNGLASKGNQPPAKE